MKKRYTIEVNGQPLSFDADQIPSLFLTYIAAERAEYYAALDESRDKINFAEAFSAEMRHAKRNRDEITDWLENNTNCMTDPIMGVEAKPVTI